MFRRASLLSFTAALSILALFCAPACVEREETITIMPDGTIHVEVEFEGGVDDVTTGDALLEDPGPWTVNDTIKTDEDGDRTLTRKAALTVPPGADLPTHFAGDDDDLADLALNFTTAVRTEDRPGGTYYHFKRVYHRRDWSHVEYYRRTFLQDELKKLDGKDLADLSEQDRGTVAEALITFEAIKTLKIAEAAANALNETLPQEDWLAIHQGIRDVFEDVDRQDVVELLQLEGEEAAAEIDAAVRDVNQKLESTIESVLDQRDPTGLMRQTFMDQFERERRRYAITEDLQDENIKVVARMPGRIIGHNSISGDAEDGAVQWEFDGKALNDRDVILLATSVVEQN
ncbi:MAG TPA: hypothetical protein VM243_21085 [Phycisphaerae bacterium]|nr:hypothetical protein [Phycisphaerae bacterium]